MHRLITVFAVAATAAALFFVPGRASAEVTSFTPAQARCEAAGGVFFSGAEVGLPEVQYLCSTDAATSDLGGAQQICENAYRGTFFLTNRPPLYACLAEV